MSPKMASFPDRSYSKEQCEPKRLWSIWIPEKGFNKFTGFNLSVKVFIDTQVSQLNRFFPSNPKTHGWMSMSGQAVKLKGDRIEE